MKRFTLVFASLMMLICLKVNAQNERILLFECFTNASCGPCASQNPALDALINNNPDRIAAIKYHMNWPGENDPMYLHNPADNNARRGVYNVNSVPHTVVDGIRFSNMPSGLNQNAVNNWLNIESPFEMRLSYEVDEVANTITVHVMGRASEAISGNVKLYVGVIEREIHYNSAPGSNGERDFYSVMKKLLPSSSGRSFFLHLQAFPSARWRRVAILPIPSLGSWPMSTTTTSWMPLHGCRTTTRKRFTKPVCRAKISSLSMPMRPL